MKICFTSVGRRVELIQSFRNASSRLGCDLLIYGTDINETAPALFFCDKKIIAPKIDDDDYIPFLLKKCGEYRIDALIPTIDTDLLKLSKARKEFERVGTKVFISDYDKVKVCRDKRLTYKYFVANGLLCPNTYDDYEDYCEGFPAFIKPKDGSSSVMAYIIKNKDDLRTYSNNIENYIIQKYIDGTEYTVDAFCDYYGNPVLITPRVRLAVRAGEVLKTRIDNDETIIEEVKKLIEDFKPRGQITIQLIREKQTNEDYYIEINPRFGGGAPLSIKAGADSAECMLRILNGEKLSFKHCSADDGAVFSRFDQSIRVN